MDNQTIALEPCPFCGGVAELDRRQCFRHYRTGEPLDQVSIYCTSCSANISHYPGDLDCDRDATADLCIAAWNTRTQAPAPARVGGDVVELLDQAYSIFTHCTVTDGSCCCGDSMENHANPMYCGHSPTDHGGYVVDQWMRAYAALQAQPAQAQPDDVVERVARALAQAKGIEICSDARYAQSSFRGPALAALAAMQQAPVADDVRTVVRNLNRLINRQQAQRGGYLDFGSADPEIVDARDMLTRLSTQPQADAVAVEQWQPIETAPRDGSKFLVWEEYYGIRIGRCKERADHDDWLSYMDAFGGSSKGGSRATHWMPLLAPPAAIRAGGQP